MGIYKVTGLCITSTKERKVIMLYSADIQRSFFDLHSDLDELTAIKTNDLFSLFDQYINISELIPMSFYNAYYSKLGKSRDFPLEGMIKSFIFYNLLSLSSISTLRFIIDISSDFRRFLKFSRTPHKSQFSRFKTLFYDDINVLFHHLVDYTDDFSTATDDSLSKIFISDTTGFELYVKENNPKFYQTILRNSKTYAKTLTDNKSFDVEKYAQSKMPKISASNSEAKLTYLNGHFGYYLKAILATNGFGLIRDINFYNTDNSLELDYTPQETKDLYDSKSLIPSLETFFRLHPSLCFSTFLGDSGFDADDNYAYLYYRNITPIINLNPRNKSRLPETLFTEDGVPLCPNNPELQMVFNGIIKSDNRADRIQFICPKRTIKMTNLTKNIMLDCKAPCTNSPYGRTKNITIHHNFRFNSAMPRSSEEWVNLYKIRTVCERTIAQLKSFMQINTSKINNTISLKSNVFLAGITQLIAFIILCKSKQSTGTLAAKTLIA